MHLIEPRHGKRKWDIRIRNHDGRVVKISGDEDREVALRIGHRVEMLIKAKQNGDPPPNELQSWIDNMSTSLSDRLVELGLIDRRRLERNKPISELIEQYGSIVASRKSNKRKHGRHQEGRVRIACTSLKVKQFCDLSGDALLKYLADREMATSTRRGYIIVMKDFAKQMVRLGVAKESPFAHIKPPGQYEDPEYERQPLTIAQFQKLMKHMDTFERYFGQKAPWTAHERKLVYWTAVKTAYRQKELRALRVCNLYLDEQPPVICMKARHTKNKTEGEVPIPDDLAAALKKHVAKLEATDPVFKLPATSGSIVDIMRRDLEGAGIVWKLPTGEIIDFHTLRATCITWWLDVDKLSPKSAGSGAAEDFGVGLQLQPKPADRRLGMAESGTEARNQGQSETGGLTITAFVSVGIRGRCTAIYSNRPHRFQARDDDRVPFAAGVDDRNHSLSHIDEIFLHVASSNPSFEEFPARSFQNLSHVRTFVAPGEARGHATLLKIPPKKTAWLGAELAMVLFCHDRMSISGGVSSESRQELH